MFLVLPTVPWNCCDDDDDDVIMLVRHQTRGFYVYIVQFQFIYHVLSLMLLEGVNHLIHFVLPEVNSPHHSYFRGGGGYTGNTMRNESYKMCYSVGFYSALRYRPEGREFDSRWGHWDFSLT